MATLYYVGVGGGDERKTNTTGEKQYLQIEDISEKIKQIHEQIRFSISAALEYGTGKSIQHLSAVFGENQSEEDHFHTRELLKDHHGTFSIFEKATHAACIEAGKGRKVSIDIYVRDISNPEFLKTMQGIKDQGIDTQCIVLDINPDDYGILNFRAMKNLGEISKLGFTFTLSDFILDGDEIRADNLNKFLNECFFPTTIKIAKSIYEKLRNRTVKITSTILSLLEFIRQKGISIFLVTDNKEAIHEKSKKVNLPFLESSTLASEDILTINGDLYAQEGLIRFGKNMKVDEGLSILQNHGLVGALTNRVIEKTLHVFGNGIKRSINLYLKEIGEDNFTDKIQKLLREIPKHLRKDFIFEILEVKYGALNNKALRNLRLLQKSGFMIAIDDLSICGDADRISLETFKILLEEKIIPDYIKIEGSYSEEIREGKISEDHLRYLREIIGIISLFPKKPTIIFEWIQDTEHALLINDILGIDGVNFLYQGRNIKYGNFGCTLIEKSVK